MTSRLFRFNAYLLLGLAVALCSGCQAFKQKEASTLRLHLEVNEDAGGGTKPVPVYRQNPIYVNVQNFPFLNEGSITKAYVVDALGAFQIMIQFDRRGTWIFEQYTTAHKGKRFAIFSQFGDARWLAAPMINQRIGDGVLVFTPDATREESERIVRGLNHVAKAVQKWNP